MMVVFKILQKVQLKHAKLPHVKSSLGVFAGASTSMEMFKIIYI